MKEIKKMYLFIHPPAHFSYRELMKPNIQVEENWKNFIKENGQKE